MPYLPPHLLEYSARGGTAAGGPGTLDKEIEWPAVDSDCNPTAACWTRRWWRSEFRVAVYTEGPDGLRVAPEAEAHTASWPPPPLQQTPGLGEEEVVQIFCRRLVVGLEDANLTARSPRKVCYPYDLVFFSRFLFVLGAVMIGIPFCAVAPP